MYLRGQGWSFWGQRTGKAATHWVRREHLAVLEAQSRIHTPPSDPRERHRVASARSSQSCLGHRRESCPDRTESPFPPGASRGVHSGIHVLSSRLNTIAFGIQGSVESCENPATPNGLKIGAQQLEAVGPHTTVPGGLGLA